MKWACIFMLLIVIAGILVSCAPEGSADAEVLVAIYDASINVDGTIVDVYKLHRGGSCYIYFGRERASGELMMGIAW